jgi:hypothetical protein
VEGLRSCTAPSMLPISSITSVLTWIGAGVSGAWEVSDAWPFFHERGLATVALAASLIWGAYQFRGSEGVPGHAVLAGFLHGTWGVLIFLWGTIEVFHWFQLRSPGEGEFGLPFAWAIWWMGYSWLLLQLKGNKDHVVLLGIAAGSAALALFTAGVWMLIPYQPIEEFRLLFHHRMLTILVLLAGMAGWAWSLARNGPQQAPHWLRLLPVIVVFLLFLGLSAEVRDWFALLKEEARQSGAERSFLDALLNGERLTLSIVWLIYSALLMTAGMIRRMSSLRWMAIRLFGITVLKILIWDLSYLDPFYRMFSFMGLGVILLGVSFAYQKYRNHLEEKGESH